jgi:hypothetical protein
MKKRRKELTHLKISKLKRKTNYQNDISDPCRGPFIMRRIGGKLVGCMKQDWAKELTKRLTGK